MVLYNGERAWNEPRRLEELVADADLGDLRAYIPRYTHHLIEEQSFPRARLEEVQNLISALCCGALFVLPYLIARHHVEASAAALITAVCVFGSPLTSTLATPAWRRNVDDRAPR